MAQTTVFLLLAFGLLAVTSATETDICRGLPCPEFTEVDKEGYEQRNYGKSIWVEMDSSAGGNILPYLRALKAYYRQSNITMRVPIVEVRDTVNSKTFIRGFLGQCTPDFHPPRPKNPDLCIRHLKPMTVYAKPFATVAGDATSWRTPSNWQTQVQAFTGQVTGAHSGDYTAAFYGPKDAMYAEIWLHSSSYKDQHAPAPGGHHRHHNAHGDGRDHGDGHNHRDGHHQHHRGGPHVNRGHCPV